MYLLRHCSFIHHQSRHMRQDAPCFLLSHLIFLIKFEYCYITDLQTRTKISAHKIKTCRYQYIHTNSLSILVLSSANLQRRVYISGPARQYVRFKFHLHHINRRKLPVEPISIAIEIFTWASGIFADGTLARAADREGTILSTEQKILLLPLPYNHVLSRVWPRQFHIVHYNMRSHAQMFLNSYSCN